MTIRLTRFKNALCFSSFILALITSYVLPKTQIFAQEAQSNVIYQCPMHSHIKSDKPGSCSICHMNLRKVVKKQPKLQKESKKTVQVAPNKEEIPQEIKPKTRQKKKKSRAALKVKKVFEASCPMHPEIEGKTTDRCTICGMNLALKGHHRNQPNTDHDTFICPMHQEIITDKSGRCPICGMDLLKKPKSHSLHASKKYGRQLTHFAPLSDSNDKYAGPGYSKEGEELHPIYNAQGDLSIIKITPQIVQNMGIRTSQSLKGDLFRHVKALGTIEVAENNLSVVNLRYSGWIEKLYVNETGVKVQKGQALAEIYAPALNQAQEEYLLALKNQVQLTSNVDGISTLIKSAADKCLYLGMRKSDLRFIKEKQKIMQTFTIRAPENGYVLQKNIVQGSKISSGQDLYTIGNLQSIWVSAHIYDFDAPWIEMGAHATMEANFLPGQTFSGQVRFIAPTLNVQDRTLEVRVEFDNPGLALKPGMLTTLRIDSRKRSQVVYVPNSSILYSGERHIIFVAVGNGEYEKREVMLGLSADRHLTEIKEGIQEGEWIVTSGQFLLDSESQLQENLSKMRNDNLEYRRQKNPNVSHQHDSHQKGYWTCSMHPQVMEKNQGSCPICHMDLTYKSTQ